jgi:hypothetical protein
LLNIFVENADDGSLAGDFASISSAKEKPVSSCIAFSFPINHIASGNYNIVVEVRR